MTQNSSSPSSSQPEPRWNWLYRIGGAAALITAFFIPIQIVVFLTWPPPSTAAGYFALFQSHKLLGLLDLDLLLVADSILAIPLILALYVALRKTSESFAALGAVLGLVGLAAYFSSNTAFNMLALSNQYAAAISEAQKAACLAAGQAMLAIYTGTAFQVNYLIGAVALIILSALMLRNPAFDKAAGWSGIVANLIALGLYVPVVGVYISVFSVFILEVWYVLVARSLFRLGRGPFEE